jgi:hypothetical protein
MQAVMSIWRTVDLLVLGNIHFSDWAERVPNRVCVFLCVLLCVAFFSVFLCWCAWVSSCSSSFLPSFLPSSLRVAHSLVRIRFFFFFLMAGCLVFLVCFSW